MKEVQTRDVILGVTGTDDFYSHRMDEPSKGDSAPRGGERPPDGAWAANAGSRGSSNREGETSGGRRKAWRGRSASEGRALRKRGRKPINQGCWVVSMVSGPAMAARALQGMLAPEPTGEGLGRKIRGEEGQWATQLFVGLGCEGE